VKKGDTLWIIASYDFIYGNGYHWKKIYDANKERIKNPKVLTPGQVLVIPRDS
jgi:nucleoid-associated protein YgaU